MRLGTFLPHLGEASSPELLVRSAQQAEALGEGRGDFMGTLDEVKRDVEMARSLGVDELILVPDATMAGSPDQFLRNQEVLRTLV
jgi:hypothetical protein